VQPFLLCWNQTGAIGIEEDVQTVVLDLFLRTQPVLKKIALPVEASNGHRISGLRLQSRNHSAQRQAVA
jgi:hypothetical protein